MFAFWKACMKRTSSKVFCVAVTRVSRFTGYDNLVTQLMQSRLATSEQVLISKLSCCRPECQTQKRLGLATCDRLGRVVQPKLPSSDWPLGLAETV